MAHAGPIDTQVVDDGQGGTYTMEVTIRELTNAEKDASYRTWLAHQSQSKLGQNLFNNAILSAATCGESALENGVSFIAASLPVTSAAAQTLAIEVEDARNSGNGLFRANRVLTTERRAQVDQEQSQQRGRRNLLQGGLITGVADSIEATRLFFTLSSLRVDGSGMSIYLANLDWTGIYQDSAQTYLAWEMTGRNNLAQNSLCVRNAHRFMISMEEAIRRNRAARARR